jgi:hypothetical protein
MAIGAKELETLRAESQQLSSRVTRLSIILLSVLAVVIITITTALEKIDVREVKHELDAAKIATDTVRGLYYAASSDSKAPASDADAKIAEKLKESYQDTWFKASKKQEEVQHRLDALLKESLSIKLSVLGSGLSIDVRSWIYCLPFVILIAVVYIQILRKKQRTILTVAASQLSNSSEATKLDQLIFSAHPVLQTPYSKSPGQLEVAIYLLTTIFLLSCLIVSLDAAEIVLLGLSWTETIQYLLMLLTVTFYGVSYYYYTASAMDEQAAALTGWPPKQSFAIKSWQKLKDLFRRFTHIPRCWRSCEGSFHSFYVVGKGARLCITTWRSPFPTRSCDGLKTCRRGLGQ